MVEFLKLQWGGGGFIQFINHSCMNLGNVDKRYLLLNYFQGHKPHATKLKTCECKEATWIVFGDRVQA